MNPRHLLDSKSAIASVLLWARLFAMFCLAAPLESPAAQEGAAPLITLDDRHRDFLKAHCEECHGEKKQEGKVRLDQISFQLNTIQGADLWQRVLNNVNSGDMPPEDAPQPPPQAKANFLEALSLTLVAARRTLSDSGGRSLVRRLNRREYQNTIRDLLGVEVDVRDLPPDTGNGTFDTVGSSLFLSSDQLEQYLALGRRALEDAFSRQSSDLKRKGPLRIHGETEQVANRELRQGVEFHIRASEPVRQWWTAVNQAAGNPENAGALQEILALAEVRESPVRFYRHWSKLHGAPPPSEFGFKDPAEAEMKEDEFERVKRYADRYAELPRVGDGSYLFVFRVRHEEKIAPPASWPPGQYLLRFRVAALQGVPESWHFIEVGRPNVPGAYDLISAHQVVGTLEEPQVVEVPVTLTSTDRRPFAIREKRNNSREQEVALWVLHERKHNAWRPPSAWIDWIELEGPIPTTPTAELFADRPPREILAQFTATAFRGQTPRPEFIDGLARIYEAHRSTGASHEKALIESLSVVLASPGFVYLAEPGPYPGTETAVSQNPVPRPLSLVELASRLSYFLWSAPPDTGLLSTPDLASPKRLGEQLERLIQSPKSDAFVRGFVHQWLGLDRLNFFQFNPRDFPGFDDSFKNAAREEVFRTFAHVLRSRGALSELLKSKQVVVNGLLAQFYGLEGITGDAWRPVSLAAGSPRGGLLGMSAILAMGGNGERTSPVERGAWILRKILHDPPPPAPPNVPQLSRLADRPLSPRERIAAHQDLPQCTHCHRKIDPLGFGLENFDASGAWRASEKYRKSHAGQGPWPVDPSGAFFNGPAFKDYFELRDLISGRVEDFAQGFTEALIEYALGRPYGFSDAQLANDILSQAKARNYELPAFFEALVASESFLKKR
jgi:hypothetical protein